MCFGICLGSRCCCCCCKITLYLPLRTYLLLYGVCQTTALSLRLATTQVGTVPYTGFTRRSRSGESRPGLIGSHRSTIGCRQVDSSATFAAVTRRAGTSETRSLRRVGCQQQQNDSNITVSTAAGASTTGNQFEGPLYCSESIARRVYLPTAKRRALSIPETVIRFPLEHCAQ